MELNTQTIPESQLYCDADVLDVSSQLNDLEVKVSNNNSESSEDYSDEDDDWDFDEGVQEKPGTLHSNAQNPSTKVQNYQPRDAMFRKYSNKINVFTNDYLPESAANSLSVLEKKLHSERLRVKDKHDRATVEQVMDPRTRMVLFKLLNKRIISEVNGCISTGKEANVYYSLGPTGTEYAIKVYKTSILIFKDRDKYVRGEFRFRHGYCRHNPRKMVKTWAEKEMRNLSRMHSNGVPVPEPILLRSHVLLMKFIGKNGFPACRLKEYEMNETKAREFYREMVLIMWKIYNKCKLVHADLSEYNILVFQGELVIIDVSQSVEHDHPMALEFLRKDCSNITEFFKKSNFPVNVLRVKELFDFITDPTVNEDNVETCLDALSVKAETTENSVLL